MGCVVCGVVFVIMMFSGDSMLYWVVDMRVSSGLIVRMMLISVSSDWVLCCDLC